MPRIQDIIIAAGLAANRPAPGTAGRLYYSTDSQVLERDTSTGWETYSGGGGGVWELISETVLGAPAASVTFAAIPGTYRSLMIHTQGRSDRAAESDSLIVRFNADAGNNYDWMQHYASTGAHIVQAFRAQSKIQSVDISAANGRANNWTTGWALIIGYALADREKWLISPTAAVFGDVSADTDLIMRQLTGRWRNTAAITSILLLPNVGPNFVTGSRFTLYGIT